MCERNEIPFSGPLQKDSSNSDSDSESRSEKKAPDSDSEDEKPRPAASGSESQSGSKSDSESDPPPRKAPPARKKAAGKFESLILVALPFYTHFRCCRPQRNQHQSLVRGNPKLRLQSGQHHRHQTATGQTSSRIICANVLNLRKRQAPCPLQRQRAGPYQRVEETRRGAAEGTGGAAEKGGGGGASPVTGARKGGGGEAEKREGDEKGEREQQLG